MNLSHMMFPYCFSMSTLTFLQFLRKWLANSGRPHKYCHLTVTACLIQVKHTLSFDKPCKLDHFSFSVMKLDLINYFNFKIDFVSKINFHAMFD